MPSLLLIAHSSQNTTMTKYFLLYYVYMLTYYHILSTSIHSTTTAAHRGCKSKWLRIMFRVSSLRLESWAPCTLELTILFIYMTSCIALSSTLVGYYQLYRLEGQSLQISSVSTNWRCCGSFRIHSPVRCSQRGILTMALYLDYLLNN